MPLFDQFYPLCQAQPGGVSDIIDKLARTPLSKVFIFVVVLTVIRLIITPRLLKAPPHLRKMGLNAGLQFTNELLDAVIYAAVFVFMVIRPFGVQAFKIPSGSMWSTLYVNDYIVANKAIYRYTEPKVGDIVVFRPPVRATLGHPEQVDSDGQVNVDFVKRCQGVPGDIVELRAGVLYRNGKPVDDNTKHYSRCVDTVPMGENCVNYQELTDAEKTSMPKASFKLVKYKGQIIPLNYLDESANEGLNGPHDMTGSPLLMAHPDFAFSSLEEEKQVVKLPAVAVPKGYYLMIGDNRNNSFDGRGWGLVPRDSITGRAEFTWLPLSRLGRLH